MSFGLRRSSFFSAQSEEEMDNSQQDSIKQLKRDTTQACSSLAEGVQQLRNDTTCKDVIIPITL